MRIIHGPRRNLHHYFLSLISAENRKLISFYLYLNKSINTKSTMKGRIPLTNQTKLVCNTLVSTTRRFLKNQKYHFFLTIKETMQFSSSFLQFSLQRNSNNNYTRQWRDELTLENHDLPGKETLRDTSYHGSLRMNKSRRLPGDIKVQCGLTSLL